MRAFAGRRHVRDKPGKDPIMRISARNQIKGTVVEVTKGATTSHVRVDIGGGQIVTSSITNEAVDELGIKAKGHVTVVVKASDVMIAVD
jgi:molybdopterin-binding protein